MAKTDTVDPTTPEGGKKPAGRPAKKKAFKKRGEKRVVHHGLVHVHASFNNTQITITDTEGNVIAWSSAGGIGFKGSRKGTPYAATQAAVSAGNTAKSGTKRYDASHLPSTISSVDSRVVRSKSRLPRTRSSASEVAAPTLKKSNPAAT